MQITEELQHIFQSRSWLSWVVSAILIVMVSITYYYVRVSKHTKPNTNIDQNISVQQEEAVEKHENTSKPEKKERQNTKDLIKITLIPGETSEIFLENVAKKLDINATKLWNSYQVLAKYPEAAISADTYLVPPKMNEKKLIKFLLASSERAYEKLAIEAYGIYDRTQWLRILTIASIIQKEAANNQEMPFIASVIFNRLKKHMRLQMDGTLNYGKYSHIKVTPERIKTDTTTFNTYKHRGLPLSPIGSVGKQAIKAAISPAETKYLYFMRNKDGVHDFTDTFKKHRKNIKKLQ